MLPIVHSHRRLLLSGLVLILISVQNADAAGNWSVYNDDKNRRSWRVEVQDGDARLFKTIKWKETATFRLGDGPHTLWTMLADRSQRQKKDQINLDQLGSTDISDIRTPVPKNGPHTIAVYQDMPGFRASKRDYESFRNDLRRSKWEGTYRGSTGAIDLGRRRADNGTNLDNIEYVAGDVFYIVGDWEHAGRTGQFLLEIAKNRPTAMKGYYREKTDRRKEKYSDWISGTAKRVR